MKKLNIPNLLPIDLKNHPNKLFVNRVSLRIPMVNIIFSDSLNDSDDIERQAEQQISNIREMLNEVKEYYLENSYGTFFFEAKIRTVFLSKPRDWKGNASKEPQYDSEGNLINRRDFPIEEDYTGFNGGTIVLRQFTDDDLKVYFRNYNAIAERNYCLAALKGLESQENPYPWDDQLSFRQWLEFGIPDRDSNAFICFLSNKLGRGGIRTFATWLGENHKEGNTWSSKSLPIEIAGRTLRKYIYAHHDWSPLAHELGHSLETPDLYNFGSEGFLGEVSMMAYDFKKSHFDAFLKLRLGWINPKIITPRKGIENISLRPIYRSPQNAILIYPDRIGYPDEFFLIEVRVKDGLRWDNKSTKYDKNLKSDHVGVFIYHVNTLNENPSEPRIDLEGDNQISGVDLKVFNSSTRKQFTSEDSKFYDGNKSGLSIKIINEHNNRYDLEISWNYNRGTSELNFLSSSNKLERLISNDNWRKTWDKIVPGNFGGSVYTDLLFYDKTVGEAQFYSMDSRGGMSQLGNLHSSWRKTWDKIVPGNFGGSGHTDLLFYDKTVGGAQFYTTDGRGGMNQLGNFHSGWRKTWDKIVPGNFGGSGHTDLLFYDKTVGGAQFYTTHGRGGMNQLGNFHSGWRKTWDKIVPGNFGRSGHTDLLFYDKTVGEAQFYTTDGRGWIHQLGNLHSGWRKTWDIITTFQFRGSSTSGILFYDSTNGCIEIFKANGMGGMIRLNKTDGIRRSWDMIIPRNHSRSFKGEFLFYDRGN